MYERGTREKKIGLSKTQAIGRDGECEQGRVASPMGFEPMLAT